MVLSEENQENTNQNRTLKEVLMSISVSYTANLSDRERRCFEFSLTFYWRPIRLFSTNRQKTVKPSEMNEYLARDIGLNKHGAGSHADYRKYL
ncbi:hypothetical protein CS022_09025 [Veronia nyctiphanis]|uniref:Uncharacterized protein n=1 Tax=Veronia nyctiphanis TaxID=1278244 RepID=A0A4Q0YX36_9GAMM|nr:hypothetical protein CS022_09025 [Veronia nyctiphanis]